MLVEVCSVSGTEKEKEGNESVDKTIRPLMGVIAYSFDKCL